MQIEVVYAESERQRVHTCSLVEGACVRDALAWARTLPDFADVDIDAHAIGVFGQVCDPTRVLTDGDRVEIYRELQMDAKQARRRRAQEQRQRKGSA